MILDKVRAAIKNSCLLKRNETVVVGVSGGPDSLALLYLLSSLKKEFGVSLHVAHLNHNLRKSSAGDLAFVAGEARKLGLGFTAGSVRLKQVSEENCRKARLEFLFGVARKHGARTIALGHTLDDQAETVLMRLIRGAGLLGLSGIVAVRQFGRFTVIRPLIEVTRREIEGYLRRRRLSPRRDETNAQDIFLRNRIRRELLPLLGKKYNPNIKQVLSNTAQSAGSDYDYLVRAAEKAAGGIHAKIGLAKLLRLHPSLKRIVLRLMAGNLQGDLRRITARHIREIEDLASNRPAGSVVDLPKGLSVRKTKKNLIFYRS
jgi:tRNA(Ile)-lysidine synthase